MATRRLSPEQRARIFKALSDPRRVELVDALAKEGPLCGTELAARLGISIALLSHHWEVLCEAGLLDKTRVGQLRFCSLDLNLLREATWCWDDGAAPGEVAAKKKATKESGVTSKRRSSRARKTSA